MTVIQRREILGGAVAASVLSISGQAMASSMGDIREILRRRVDVEKVTVGMAAAVVSKSSLKVICYGRERLTDNHAVSGKTLFEIGSITKVFTALLLTSLAREGVLAIDDPVAKHLPADFVFPERDGRAITLADLATHTSGLPRFPSFGLSFADFPSIDEYIGAVIEAAKLYSLPELKSWLADFDLPRTPGSGWEYSNIGYALLGLALAHRADRPYEDLLKQRIFDQIGLDNTFLYPPARVAARLAEGHDAKLAPLLPYDGGIFAPAGALRSTADDLARFMRAIMPGSGSPLEPSGNQLLQMVRPAPQAGGKQALGWEVLPAQEGDYVSKDGVTSGQCATAVFDPAARRAVIVLSNTFPLFSSADTSPSGGGTGAGDLARHLLRPSIPLGI